MAVSVFTHPETPKRAASSLPTPDTESMRAVLTAIRYDLSLDQKTTRKQVESRMSGLANAANHMARSLSTTPDGLTVDQAVRGEEVFRQYVTASSLLKSRKSALLNSRNTLLRYARRFGFSPRSFSFLDEWDAVKKALGSEPHASAIIHHAMRRGLRCVDFSQADIDLWAQEKLAAGRTHVYVSCAEVALRCAIRKAGLETLFRGIDTSFRTIVGYKLRMPDMPKPLREEILGIVASRRSQAKLGKLPFTPTTEQEIIAHFEDFCGYAVDIRGIKDVVTLRSLLTESFVREFAFWQRNDRKYKRTTIVGRLSRMFSSLACTPAFSDYDFSWIDNVYRKLRKEPESALKERRRQRYVPFQELALVPGRMRRDRLALVDPSPWDLSWRHHDELILASVILAQWPPRFIRLAEVGRHVFKGKIPTDGPPFSVPTWAKELLVKNPDTEFWQFRHEDLKGQLHRGLVLRQIVPLLESYLADYRSLLIDADAEPRLFCNRRGQPLDSTQLRNVALRWVRRYVGKRVSIMSIRSAFAHLWRERRPTQDALLAQIQWVDYPTIKLRYDEEYRRQRAARVHRRKSRYA